MAEEKYVYNYVKYLDKEIKSDMRKKWLLMYWRFKKPSTYTQEEEEGYGMTLHSSSEVIEDWILNMDLIDIKMHHK